MRRILMDFNNLSKSWISNNLWHFFSEFMLCNESGNLLTDTRLFLGDIVDQNCEDNILDGDPSYPQRDIYLRFFIGAMIDSMCFMAVLSRKVFKDSISPKFSSRWSILKQPERMRVSREFNLLKLLGRLLRLLQPFKFTKTRWWRSPIDWWTSNKLVQSLSNNFSSLGSFEKSGVWVR